ncbi:MAG TPA: alpha-amylase, partial [Chloroflexi bacterium]|nr:alpha-amylase [Chloroflexota bacterium]
MEFHISRTARDRYQFDQALFSLSGNVIFANFHAARVFVQRMNEKRDLARYPERGVRAGQINTMGLIDEIMHVVFRRYRRQENPQALEQALSWLDERLGREAVDEALRQFTDEFPPVSVYRHESSVDEYLAGETAGVPHRHVVLEELITLWLANANPAFSPFQELFDDTSLSKQTAYREMMSGLHDFFETQPPFGPDEENLLDMLRAPAIAQPHSLPGQLEYIRQRWGYILGDYLYRLLSSLDFIAEEEKVAFLGPGPSRVYDFSGMGEYERFSPDQAWMPSVVMIAKNTYVWLDQLSKRYERSIIRLDQIPDEELDTLARWGFTGLWLIGLWERSEASKRIKQMCGNPEAVASAYSLYDYQIATDLGGDEAYRNLRDRAWRRGIRLASDMVPNHVGIDGKWVIEHPDCFISLDHSPFPAYTFDGPNLSRDERVGIYLEDHYYERSDAAVVFKRVDHWSSDEKYIYHGNDGTSMPWNDTAQLNYLKPEVREAVIQKILDVARQFPIIRFDAAMTLTKKHYQRLWFPEPGSGGDIPSRAEHSMTREQFDAAMPNEFWREVVDRVAEEVPDTLLLAEAFWLMEGYFVRTLGMHRVYNSAFMNMLRDEDNAKYRSVIKNTLAFDPQILKRYVNFMNNPDERTAVDQFGKGDKYFGICTLLATMPGLPMFGHGQVEGFTEKYGMEYRRAYWDERPDPALVARHEREIFPLLQRRTQFAGVAHFLLYDLFTPEGYVDENVFAYSNQENGQRSLVIYHNKYAETRGWIRTSVAYALKMEMETETETGQGNQGDEKRLAQKSLGEGLALAGGDRFTIFRDQTSGLEYIRPSWELCEKGLYVELGAYQYHVFLDFREVQDDESHRYSQLTAYLDGRGVPNVEDAMRELLLQPLHQAFRALVNADTFERISESANQRISESANQ